MGDPVADALNDALVRVRKRGDEMCQNRKDHAACAMHDGKTQRRTMSGRPKVCHDCPAYVADECGAEIEDMLIGLRANGGSHG